MTPPRPLVCAEAATGAAIICTELLVFAIPSSQDVSIMDRQGEQTLREVDQSTVGRRKPPSILRTGAVNQREAFSYMDHYRGV